LLLSGLVYFFIYCLKRYIDMKELILNSEQQRNYCQTWIKEQTLDGKKTVILKDTDLSPTARQRRTWRMWCGEIAKSGLGQDDVPEDVHIRMKWKIVRPMFLETSGLFAGIYEHFMKLVEFDNDKAEKCREFSRDYIHTEQLSKAQRVESLRQLFRYWVDKGANLTDPNLLGLKI